MFKVLQSESKVLHVQRCKNPSAMGGMLVYPLRFLHPVPHPSSHFEMFLRMKGLPMVAFMMVRVLQDEMNNYPMDLLLMAE